MFGLDLYVDSIAFQEQDKVVSACATTSIWSTLQALKWRAVREIPSCSEITTNAINFIEGSSNSFPNKELSNKQILRALDVSGLRHHSESLSRIGWDELSETVKSYIDSGLPLILGADVYAVAPGGLLTKIGGHAVCVLGYKLAPSGKAFYIHDDRLGPFARATYIELPSEGCPAGLVGSWGLELQGKDDDGNWAEAHEVLVPNFLIVATDRKVRLPLSYAVNTAKLITKVYEEEVKSLAEAAQATEFASLQNQLTFKVRLAEISDLKRELLQSPLERCYRDVDGNACELTEAEFALAETEKSKFLTTGYARFQWVIDFSYRDIPAFSVLIDATDIPQGHAVSAVLSKNKSAADVVLTVLEIYAKNKAADAVAGSNLTFFGSFLRRLKPESSGISEHLNETYGELRAPRYLKESEFANGDVRVNASVQTFYEAIDEPLEDLFPGLVVDDEESYRIWAIAHDGGLLVGEEIDKMGHPCLTGFKPARIAGELRRTSSGWTINSKSGRYSSDYSDADRLLANALRKFKTIFGRSQGSFTMVGREPKH
ncbi:hypothetical protein AB1286_09330 [Trinickia sp. NRRL B-1857]|uniref:hypothetical protein n=1 Tax=Trinickia sp. NRRL B-1857 TaxID=3162879 RepID=UPI003D2E940F